MGAVVRRLLALVRDNAAVLLRCTPDDVVRERILAVQAAVVAGQQDAFDARDERIRGLEEEVRGLLESRTAAAVEHVHCPRCAAPAGERCRVGGRILRRTHKERTAFYETGRVPTQDDTADAAAQGVDPVPEGDR